MATGRIEPTNTISQMALRSQQRTSAQTSFESSLSNASLSVGQTERQVNNRETAPPPPASQPTAGTSNEALQVTEISAQTPEEDAIVKNTLLVNEALANLNFSNPEQENSLLVNKTPAILTATEAFQDLPPLLQNQLFINNTLLALRYVPNEEREPLLIDEIPADLEAQEIFQDLDVAQQNQLLINENIEDIILLSPEEEDDDTEDIIDQFQETETTEDIEIEAQTGVETPDIQEAVETTATAVAVETVAEEEEVVAAPAEVVEVEAATVTEETAEVEEAVNPASLPFLLNPDRTPYVLAAYETRDANMLPGEPTPLDRQVEPVAAAEGSRQISQLVISPEQGRAVARGARRQFETTEPAPSPLKSIDYTLKQANDDLAARGSPLHMVLARNREGYTLDIYDCSYSDRCVLEYNVPLEFNKLHSTLDSISRETGLIVNKVS